MYRFLTLYTILALLSSLTHAETGSSYTEFVHKVFGQQEIQKPKTLWLNKELKAEISNLFDYKMDALRLRYWQHQQTSAWILEELGKDELITMGLIVKGGLLQSVEVLEYRESRGGEIQHPFFTKQFINAHLLNDSGQLKLDRHIDGITGATLSVRAMTKVTKVALFLHQKVTTNHDVSESPSP